jgi:hypothetical protein
VNDETTVVETTATNACKTSYYHTHGSRFLALASLFAKEVILHHHHDTRVDIAIFSWEEE